VKTLVIDTATKACSVALYEDRTVLASAHEVIGRGHAERLLPLISALPERGKADRIFVDVGPGSFTGIRVGIAAAKALGFAWQIAVHGYSSLQLVAAMARDSIRVDEVINVVMTGGHGEYFHQCFDDNGLPTNEIRSLTPMQVEQEIGDGYAAGDIAVGNHIDILLHASQWHLIANVPPMAPSPVYGRAPDAKLPQTRVV
jgi:tRNA threonylcarbamoyladenosine biosynthesis protein TsaB